MLVHDQPWLEEKILQVNRTRVKSNLLIQILPGIEFSSNNPSLIGQKCVCLFDFACPWPSPTSQSQKSKAKKEEPNFPSDHP